MILLYIPFRQDESGDLSIGAEIWRTNVFASLDKEVKIIYHQDNYDDSKIRNRSEVYILAHGYGNRIGNFSASDKSIYIDTATLAERFNNDCVLISNKIRQIHIYTCGTQNDNAVQANIFQSNLYGKERIKITYYAGTICPPDRNGKKWSFLHDKPVSVESQQFSLDHVNCKSLKKFHIDLNMKAWDQNNFLKPKKQEKRDALSSKRSLARYKLFSEHRERNMKMDLDTDSMDNQFNPVV